MMIVAIRRIAIVAAESEFIGGDNGAYTRRAAGIGVETMIGGRRKSSVVGKSDGRLPGAW